MPGRRAGPLTRREPPWLWDRGAASARPRGKAKRRALLNPAGHQRQPRPAHRSHPPASRATRRGTLPQRALHPSGGRRRARRGRKRPSATDGSGLKSLEWAKRTPLVPTEELTSPGPTMPVPTAAAALSPPPPLPRGCPAAAEFFGDALTKEARVLGAFVDFGHPAPAGSPGRQGSHPTSHGPACPATGCPPRPRRLLRVLARELEPHVVLGQEHTRGPIKVLWLFILEPDDLRCLEAREGRVAGDRDKTLPAPPHWLSARTACQCAGSSTEAQALLPWSEASEKDRAVHLPGEPDACYLLSCRCGDLL